MRGITHCLEIWGDLACFTRPEMKVERYSYPLITPSAARGIFDAIYFKKEPNFYWQLEKIEILNPIKYISLRRNEVKDKVPNHSKILAWAEGGEDIEPLWADGTKALIGNDTKGRTQRQTTALKNVRYRLYAHVQTRGNDTNIKTIDAQFSRRAKQGKCFYQPFLGCREFPAFFELIENPENQPLALDQDIDTGWMLYDVFDLACNNNSMAKPHISVFHAQVKQGVLKVPAYQSEQVKKSVEIPEYD